MHRCRPRAEESLAKQGWGDPHTPLRDARIVRRPAIIHATVIINHLPVVIGNHSVRRPTKSLASLEAASPRPVPRRLRRPYLVMILSAERIIFTPFGRTVTISSVMKTLAAMVLIFSLTSLAVAQKVEIIGLDHSGLIAWSSTNQSLYCGLETKWNLQHTWLPIQEWNLLMTTPVTNTTVDINAVSDQISVILKNLTGDGLHGLFFRIVASTSPLGPSYATNLVRVVNTSTSVLANVEIGLIENWSHNPITNLTSLGQGDTSPIVPVVQDIPLPTSDPISVVVPMIGVSVQDGFYLSYDHNGSNRIFESTVVPFGDPEKNIRMTVSNVSIKVTYEWLGFSGTRQY